MPSGVAGCRFSSPQPSEFAGVRNARTLAFCVKRSQESIGQHAAIMSHSVRAAKKPPTPATVAGQCVRSNIWHCDCLGWARHQLRRSAFAHSSERQIRQGRRLHGSALLPCRPERSACPERSRREGPARLSQATDVSAGRGLCPIVNQSVTRDPTPGSARPAARRAADYANCVHTITHRARAPRCRVRIGRSPNVSPRVMFTGRVTEARAARQ